ncbi:hypothetical protein [Ruegeria sp. HKCCA6948]|nr:hypothetical protein [Ruegeria sp. HKCCA6948]
MKTAQLSLFQAMLLFILIGTPGSAESQDRFDELNRPVRVLVVGVTNQLLGEVRALDVEEKIDFSFPSNNLSDFDMFIALVDDFEEAGELKIVADLGVEKSFVANEGEAPFSIEVNVRFAERVRPFDLIAVDRRQFYARDITCHSVFLKDLILSLDFSQTIQSESHYKLTKDCAPVS